MQLCFLDSGEQVIRGLTLKHTVGTSQINETSVTLYLPLDRDLEFAWRLEKHEKIIKQNCIMMQLRILPSDHDIKNLIIFYLIKEIKIYLVWFGLNRPIIITEVLSKICHWVRKTIINTMNIIN